MADSLSPPAGATMMRASELSSAARVLAFLAALVMAAPVTLSNESNEMGSAKERVEDASLTTRSVSEKRACLCSRRIATVFAALTHVCPGREYRPEPAPARGHRLPNGLLAPLTC